ncbi:DUF5655 domain-containing protein [Streptomyces sp. BBFR2]|uniref:DUF5655 domain-containing protein n=1 Tax=Streptomyces sp. BBFR2 TaxID=3372854 RepID=UPI0037DA19EF
MTDLMLFRQDAAGRDVELRGSAVALEVELQRRIEAGMEEMLGIRFLASEYVTGPWHRGRIDTLGLDENNSPVVIEYKKGAESGVLSQAVSYLSWLDSAHHEFEALVKERLGEEVAESVDWRNARMVCIAASFSHHDRVAVQRLRERIDLIRYRVFDGGLLSLMLVDSSPGVPHPGPKRQHRRAPDLPGPDDGVSSRSSFQATPVTAPSSLQALYAELDEGLTAWGEVEVVPLRYYIAYRRMTNLASVVFRPKHEVILLYLSLDPDRIDWEEGFTRDMRGVGHHGTGDVEVRITSAGDLEKAEPLIRMAFQAA